jgi:hypothetical protein
VRSAKVCPEHEDLMEDRQTETRATIWMIRRMDLAAKNGNNGDTVSAEFWGIKIKGRGAVVTKAILLLVERGAVIGGVVWLVAKAKGWL